jgi:hypothetical protein
MIPGDRVSIFEAVDFKVKAISPKFHAASKAETFLNINRVVLRAPQRFCLRWSRCVIVVHVTGMVLIGFCNTSQSPSKSITKSSLQSIATLSVNA